MNKKKLYNKTDAAHVVFRKLLGYYGRSKKMSRGPTLLGMETNFHKFVPNADDIKAAVRDAKCEYRKGILSLR